ncbi:MAG TPA: M1 family aminopeptidase [Sulfolobales archaeon]|nr:M1 family aminopeptidase [Sulfolobales archaeon]
MKGLPLKTGRDFVFPGYTAKYAREYWFRIRHADIYIRTDIVSRSIRGRVVHDIEMIDDRGYIELDAVDMSLKAIRINGSEAKYSYDGSKITVMIPRGLGSNFQVEILYESKPIKGLHFVLPKSNNDYPQMWSQGEAEDTRYWIPIYDYPNMRLTWTLTAEVPSLYSVVSNGDLVSVEDIGDGYKRWRYRMDNPMPSYLIALAVGVFDEAEEVVDGIKLRYLVPKGMGGFIKNSFSKTPDMVRFFNEYLGVRYPYRSYTQVCVKEFIVGGMENVTATFLTDLTLHDDIAHKEFSSDPLVAHELAHQWFGDLVTCKDWSNIWLNESFATYLEALYTRRDKGEDEFIYELYSDLKSYLEEYGRRYSRPIVMRIYKDPDELFDAHSYPKGALVLHTLRNIVGESKFREALKNYLSKYSFGNTDTEDLRKVFEEASGKDLEWFFDQYVYSSGHPVVSVKWEYEPRDKVLKISIKQAQGQDSLETYRLPLRLLIRFPSGSVERKIMFEEKERTIFLEAEEPPKYICPNPDFDAFAVYEVDEDVEILGNMLEDPHVFCKLLAIEGLSKKTGSRVVEILAKALERESFWGVQAEIARALGKVGGEDAKKALIDALRKIDNPRSRRAVVEALGNFRGDEEVAKTLLGVLSNPSETYYVRASAASSLGKTRVSWAFNELVKYLDTPSHAEIITRGVLQGLANIGGDESLKVILRYLERDKHTMVRVAAASSLGKFPGRRDVIERLIEILRTDPSHRVRMAAISSMEELKNPEFLEVLGEATEKDPVGFVRRRAREAAKRIRDHLEKGIEYKQLREEVERLREESRKIIEKIERYEAKGAGV